MKLQNWITAKSAKYNSQYVTFTDCYLTRLDGTTQQVVSLSGKNLAYVTLPFLNLGGQYLPQKSIPFGASNSYLAINVVCGSGDTPVTINDYNLENPFKTLQSVSQQTQPIIVNHVCKGVKYTHTYTNNTGDTITVREIGIIGSDNSFSSTPTESNCVLYARDILESPLEVPSGESFTITYNELF